MIISMKHEMKGFQHNIKAIQVAQWYNPLMYLRYQGHMISYCSKHCPVNKYTYLRAESSYTQTSQHDNR